MWAGVLVLVGRVDGEGRTGAGGVKASGPRLVGSVGGGDPDEGLGVRLCSHPGSMLLPKGCKDKDQLDRSVNELRVSAICTSFVSVVVSLFVCRSLTTRSKTICDHVSVFLMFSACHILTRFMGG